MDAHNAGCEHFEMGNAFKILVEDIESEETI